VFEIGSALRVARERQRLERAEVERETRIRQRYLAALEEERFELLPARAYAKGFLRLPADFLGIDGQRFVDEFTLRFPEPELLELGSRAPTRIGRGRAPRLALVLVAVPAIAVLGVFAWRFGTGHRTPPARPVTVGRPAVLNPSVLGPGAACVLGKRRLGRPSVESLDKDAGGFGAGAGHRGRTMTNRPRRARFASAVCVVLPAKRDSRGGCGAPN
jgi:transcriptional regulator with XRE-family HTH domain